MCVHRNETAVSFDAYQHCQLVHRKQDAYVGKVEHCGDAHCRPYFTLSATDKFITGYLSFFFFPKIRFYLSAKLIVVIINMNLKYN